MNSFLGEKKVLIIDDSFSVINYITSLLKANNIISAGVVDATNAIREISRFCPDVILLDIIMPTISGFELCEKIKSMKEYMNTPIIFMTGSDDEDSIKKAFDVGASDYVVKPVKEKELISRLETHIKIKKLNDKQERINKELRSFNHMVSHDLITPLRTINKLTGYLKDYSTKVNNPDFDELVSMISKKSLDTAYLVERYSELAKLTFVQKKSDEIDMNEFVRQVFNEYNTREDVIFDVGDLPKVNGDKVLLKQALVNMFANALKYTKDRNPAMISVDCNKMYGRNVFSVADNGIGFDMKYSSDVFKVFTRLHSQKEFEGTGMGLAIVKKIIELHDGSVWIEGKENKGATIFFTLNS